MSSNYNIYTEAPGAIIPRFTGTLSFVGSISIIYVILLSKTRLTTTYHRIMFGMSLYDIMSSISIALTTLPMPRDDEIVNSYGYCGARLGNTETCEVQGFFFLFGSAGTFLYNLILCIYYLSVFGNMMSADIMKEFLEPKMHVSALIISLSVSIPPVVLKLINPAPDRYSWCVSETLPYSTKNYIPNLILRGTVKHKTIINLYAICVAFVVLFSSLAILLITYCKLRRRFKTAITTMRNNRTETNETEGNQNDEQLESTSEDQVVEDDISLSSLSETGRMVMNASNKIISEDQLDSISSSSSSKAGRMMMNASTPEEFEMDLKIISRQNLAYFLTFVFTMGIQTLLFYQFFTGKTAPPALGALYLIFRPLQGFFNFLIFVASKIVSLRRVEPGLTMRDALKRLFCKSEADPLILTGLSRVEIAERPDDLFVERISVPFARVARNVTENHIADDMSGSVDVIDGGPSHGREETSRFEEDSRFDLSLRDFSGDFSGDMSMSMNNSHVQSYD